MPNLQFARIRSRSVAYIGTRSSSMLYCALAIAILLSGCGTYFDKGRLVIPIGPAPESVPLQPDEKPK